MPRKTRQQKMAAKMRRMKTQLAKEDPTRTSSTGKEAPTRTSTYNVKDFDVKTYEKSTDKSVNSKSGSFSYISSDIRKILLLSAGAVAIEIVLSLTINSQFAKLLLSRFGIEI